MKVEPNRYGFPLDLCSHFHSLTLIPKEDEIFLSSLRFNIYLFVLIAAISNVFHYINQFDDRHFMRLARIKHSHMFEIDGLRVRDFLFNSPNTVVMYEEITVQRFNLFTFTENSFTWIILERCTLLDWRNNK